MKFYLGGGWNPEEGHKALNEARFCAKKIFELENTKQVLHIPFARTGIMKKSRSGFSIENFGGYIKELGLSYLTATFYEDIDSFSGDTIYINGGNDGEFLLQMCKNERLLNAIKKSKLVICESFGAMIMGEYFHNNGRTGYIKGFGYIKDTIIEGHYSEKNEEERLKLGMNTNNIKYGLGIDENTFIEYENGKYGKKVGLGNIVHM